MAATTKLITLRQVCTKVGIKPKAARRVLRFSGVQVRTFRWEFTPAQAKRVTSILSA